MHLTIKERVELVLMSGADGATNRSVAKKFNRIYLAKKFCFNKNVCYYYLNCFICFGALFMAQNVCYYYLNCFICFGALFMAHPVFQNAVLRPWKAIKSQCIPVLALKTCMIDMFPRRIKNIIFQRQTNLDVG